MGNVLNPENEVKGVTTRRGKMTFEATPSKAINETGINKNEPPKFNQDVQEKPHDVGVENKSSSIPERTSQPLLKFKFNDDEPWYVDFVNYIVGNVIPPNWTFEKRKRWVARSETLKILARCHSGLTGGYHGARITENKVYESEFYWSSVFKDGNDDKDFKVGDKVLLYNSRLKMYPRKLKSKWSGSNIVKTVYSYGDVEIINRNEFRFKVNGQRLKKYYEARTLYNLSGEMEN
nr:hypothetical protein [Tanacetum cinerariifolium]